MTEKIRNVVSSFVNHEYRSILYVSLSVCDQHQISPCNINAYSTPEVMRIKDMITQGEFSIVLFIRKVRGQDRRICSLILGVKGLNRASLLLEQSLFPFTLFFSNASLIKSSQYLNSLFLK